MCYLLWAKPHRVFDNRRTQALDFLTSQMCDMFVGTGIEGLYGETLMGWGWEEEGALLFFLPDVVVKYLLISPGPNL